MSWKQQRTRGEEEEENPNCIHINDGPENVDDDDGNDDTSSDEEPEVLHKDGHVKVIAPPPPTNQPTAMCLS